MKKHVAYYRVSTDRQGQSGLGLEAQRDAVARFVNAHGILVGEFREVESGKRHKNRPQLLAALEQCKKLRATLVIAKLDRLGRNVAFISALMESNVEFVCCDNPHATRLMLHLLAAFAEHEREVISQRTTAALARIKAELLERGSRRSLSGRLYTKLGGPDPLAALRVANVARNLRPPAQAVLDLMTAMRDAGHSYREIATTLNTRGLLTPLGYRWYSSTARAVFLRLSPEAENPYAAMATAHYEDALPEPILPAIPLSGALNAGRRATERGTASMQDLNQALRMLDTFCSVGARSFVVTKIDINKKLLWGKTYSPVDLREKLPAMLRTAAVEKPYRMPDDHVIYAGENIVVRPSGPDVQFIQLDDLDDASLLKVGTISHLNLCTSAGNHQAWIALDGKRSGEEEKELARRLRKGTGADLTASGATRLAGSSNYKAKYAPKFPVVSILSAFPGRITTAERLAELGLLAEPEPVKAIPLGVSHSSTSRTWPDYARCIASAPPTNDKSGPDISRADYTFALMAGRRGWGAEAIAAKLAELSSKAHANGERYALRTAQNAVATVDRERDRQRSRA